MTTPSFLFTFFRNISFANPHYFWLLLLLIPLFGWRIWRRHKVEPAMVISTTSPFETIGKSWKQKIRWVPVVLRTLIFISIVFALARPQSSLKRNQIDVEGVDIMLALDISGSMKMMDFTPNRMEASKKIAMDFIKGRPNDRIGLVVYAGEAYTQCPLTSDHNTLLSLLEKVSFGVIDDGTAIGDGLGTAINRLRESTAKSKTIILLTDGENNTGYIDPLSAADMAKDFDIKVYTIGCGSNASQVPYPTPHGPVYLNSDFDETLLLSIAEITGGQYFRATNNKKLEQVYEEIDQMEKTQISENIFESKSDEFFPFLVLALIFFFLEFLFRYWILRGIS